MGGGPSSHARCFFTGNHIDYFLYYYIHVCKEKSNPFEINTRTQANFINVFTPDFNKTLNNNMIIETPYIERQLRCSASKQKRLKNMKNIKNMRYKIIFTVESICGGAQFLHDFHLRRG